MMKAMLKAMLTFSRTLRSTSRRPGDSRGEFNEFPNLNFQDWIPTFVGESLSPEMMFVKGISHVYILMNFMLEMYSVIFRTWNQGLIYEWATQKQFDKTKIKWWR